MDIAIVKLNNVLENSKVLKPNYHLNYGKRRVVNAIDNGHSFVPLEQCSGEIYTGGIFKRVFVEDEEYGLPYISGQHMMNYNPLSVAKIISKKYTPRQDDMTLRQNQVLVSCAGTIGNIRMIDSDLDGVIGSQDIIRILPNKKEDNYGFIYAYLSTPTAYNYIQSYIYGSVVPRIGPKTLANLPVPVFPDSKKELIHKLICESSRLRAKSNNSLRKAHKIFNDSINLTKTQKTISNYGSSQIISNYHKRLDSAYYINIQEPTQEIEASGLKYINLGDLVKSKMFNALRGKRNYVETGGVQFLSTSNISEKNPLLINKYLSTKTYGLDTLMVKKNWILISSSGQDILGSAFLVDDTYADSAVNQHSIRVIIDEEKISPHYVFGFLSNSSVKNYIRSGIYGSAVLTINEDFLKTLKIPLLEKSLMDEISNLVLEFSKSKEKACFKEKEAIDLIEKEIEEWQK